MSNKSKRGPGRPRKQKLDTLQQAHGKDEQIKRAKELEELVGIASINPYGTTIAEKFEEDIHEMSLVDLQELAVKVGVFPNGTKTALKAKLLKGFSEYNRASMVVPAPRDIPLTNPNSKKTQEALRLMKEGL